MSALFDLSDPIIKFSGTARIISLKSEMLVVAT